MMTLREPQKTPTANSPPTSNGIPDVVNPTVMVKAEVDPDKVLGIDLNKLFDHIPRPRLPKDVSIVMGALKN
jgi:hypothetical protein